MASTCGESIAVGTRVRFHGCAYPEYRRQVGRVGVVLDACTKPYGFVSVEFDALGVEPPEHCWSNRFAVMPENLTPEKGGT